MSTSDRAPQAADPSDPYLRGEQTFPSLSEAQIERVVSLGEVVELAAGEVLFRRGDRRVDFFLVLEGEVEIIDHSGGEEKVITVHAEHQFTGELDLFNDRKILVSGRTSKPTRAVRMDRVTFQRMMTAEPAIGETITRAFILRRTGLIKHAQGGVVVVGDPHDGNTLEVIRFLRRNGYPVQTVASVEDAAGVDPEGALPAVGLPSGDYLYQPSLLELADSLGLSEELREDHVHDVAVVGAGPSGLASAVYAASEGLDTVVLESLAPGGQAGTSSRIENYLGFPTGISGQALAGRAQIQAQKFGARLLVARSVASIDQHEGHFRLTVDSGHVDARSVVIATGATYRRLSASGFDRFERRGIHYAATATEADLCRDEEVVVVGGGNSAGQAAVFLSRHAKHVHMLIRSGSLAASMSQYLIARLEAAANLTLHYETQITQLLGDDFLQQVEWTHGGETSTRDVRNVFVMIGAIPNTAWLNGLVELDERGFVKTPSEHMLFGTSVPGIVAVGDVRSGSVKRVASGVGEGSVVVQGLHKFLS